MSMSMTDRYERAAQLAPKNVLALLPNALPRPQWLAGGSAVIYRRHNGQDGEVVVVDTTGARRAATVEEAELAPPEPPGRYEIREADPKPAAITSPDGCWAIRQQDGNLLLDDLREGIEPSTAKLTTDGTPDDGYGIYYGNWKAGFVQRERASLPHPPFGVLWAPDSRRVIVPRIDQSNVAVYPYLETVRQDGSFRPRVYEARVPLTGEAPPPISWYVFDVEQGTGIRLQLPEPLLFLHQDLTALRTVTFSSDSSHAYAVAHGPHMTSAHLFDIDLTAGSVREVVVEQHQPRADLNTSSYQPPNVAVIGDLEQVVWWSQRSGWGHLYLYDGRTGSLECELTSGEWLVRDLISIDRAAGWIYFTGSGREPGNPYLRRLYRVRFDGTELTLLTPEDADCGIEPSDNLIGISSGSGSAIAPDGRTILYTYSTVSQAPTTVLRRLDDGVLVATLEQADPAPLEAAGYRPPEDFETVAADGVTPLFGILYRPADFDPETRYPVLVYQYASPLMAATPRTYTGAISGPPGLLGPAAFAALGMVVVTLDARGTTGRSREFAEAGYGRLDVIGLDDYAAALEQLAERLTWFDTSRVGVLGGSYGGYTAVRAMLQFPDVFHVGIADAPLAVPQAIYPDYHWFAFHGVPTYDGSELRPSDTSHPDNYRDVDAVAQVDRLRGHLLVSVGELDENCPLNGVMPFVMAAYEANKNVDLLYVPNATHYSFTRTRYVVRRHFDYLVRHLVDGEPPASAELAALPQPAEPTTRAVPDVW